MIRGFGLQRSRVFMYAARQRMSFRRRRKRLANDRGQVMVEYVVTLILAVLPLVLLGMAMHASLARYLSPIYFMIALPIP